MKKIIITIISLLLLLLSIVASAEVVADLEEVNEEAADILNDIKYNLLDRNSMDIREIYVWTDDTEWLYVFTYVAKNQMGGLTAYEVLALYDIKTEEYSMFNVTTAEGDSSIGTKFNNELVPQLDKEVEEGRVLKLSLTDVEKIMDINQRLRQAFGLW